jgi:YidC/Oxa1 family membrane protein insertase
MITLHNYLTFDWALAIVVLVVIVRTILHPITKWSQVRMQRFGKQMQAMAPKQQKLKDKYGHDPKLLQQETAKLWREEGINPLGLLGCIPMFLQMPIWIALYALLFFAAELRHQPAFFGLFQTIGHPTFMADLAVPDHLYEFKGAATGYHVPVLSALLGPITGINILPLILAVVFYIHQTYLTPQTTQMTPEQEAQQRMIKWMSLIMFPLFMYNAPAGLTTYFVTNSALAIFEHKLIRKHIDKHDLLNLDKMKAEKANKGPGFLARMQQLAEAQRKAAEAKARKSR